jgi:hypothetical protein
MIIKKKIKNCGIIYNVCGDITRFRVKNCNLYKEISLICCTVVENKVVDSISFKVWNYMNPLLNIKNDIKFKIINNI